MTEIWREKGFPFLCYTVQVPFYHVLKFVIPCICFLFNWMVEAAFPVVHYHTLLHHHCLSFFSFCLCFLFQQCHVQACLRVCPLLPAFKEVWTANGHHHQIFVCKLLSRWKRRTFPFWYIFLFVDYFFLQNSCSICWICKVRIRIIYTLKN